MASVAVPQDKRAARIAIVEQHVRLENAHDLEECWRHSETAPATTTKPGEITTPGGMESAPSTSN